MTAFGTSFGYKPTITNLAGGVIRGGAGAAVQVSGAMLTNAGAIFGSVDLGYQVLGGGFDDSASYIASGGTVSGDVLFGSGSDVFLQTGATTGVSGLIDGGTSARNLFGRSFTADASFALDTVPVKNFQDRLAQTIGAGTTVTTTGALTGDLYPAGTGNIVKQASVAGRLIIGSLGYYASSLLPFQDTPASVVNTGTITGGVGGSMPVFTNSGTIGSMRLVGPAVLLNDNGPLSFTNTGQIAASSASSYSPSGYHGNAAQLTALPARRWSARGRSGSAHG